jgi:uncharacterized protein
MNSNRRGCTVARVVVVVSCFSNFVVGAATNDPIIFRPETAALFRFEGFTGERVRRNVENWLLPAPGANPGLLEMFQLRDRTPAPKLVPWAGEFAGKYLISLIQALRMTSNPELESLAAEIVAKLIASQDRDGYLGPFRHEERLRGHWDLWGHYHCMLALLMWHERTRFSDALACTKRVADLVCATYLGTGRRAIDAGSDEMNLAIIHSLGWLHRITKEDRYLQMMREIERDWERGGDYLRTGLNGVEFFQSPRPRWESLHNLQGLVELYRITGDKKYRRAFEHHWRSIARWDVRNSGGFSSGEQATGNPYAPTAIETCCSIAWMAISLDMLALTGDSHVADALELSTLNAWAGAQHPSGRWCTYSTPMDGMREASAHSIVFQARHGTPELNCCSVNGPRGWGMLAEWAVMGSSNGYVLNWLAPFRAALPGSSAADQSFDQARRVIAVEGNYPVEPQVTIRLQLEQDEEFTLRIRIPAWSLNTTASLNSEPLPAPKAGSYLTVRRKWRARGLHADVLTLNLDLKPRYVSGDKEASGKISIYRGPLLLAWDQRFNSFDESNLPMIDPRALAEARVVPTESSTNSLDRLFTPVFRMDIPAADGQSVRLCDFATAGATSTRYRSWLPTTNAAPPPVVTRFPGDGVEISRGKIAFRWTGPRNMPALSYTLQISESEEFAAPLIEMRNLTNREVLIDITDQFRPEQPYYWQIISSNAAGETRSTGHAARFRVNSALPRASESLEQPRTVGPNGEIIRASLRGHPAPQFGNWQETAQWREAIGPDNTPVVSLNGINQRILYNIGPWPDERYSVSLRFRVREFPTNRVGQLFSAWTTAMDDPLRLVIQNGRLFGRIESGTSYSTEGIPIELGRWYDLKAIKDGGRLSLVLDGKQRTFCNVPEYISTNAKDFALGGNPHHSGDEFLAADLVDLLFLPGPPPAK